MMLALHILGNTEKAGKAEEARQASQARQAKQALATGYKPEEAEKTKGS
jgi:hypothetical protein